MTRTCPSIFPTKEKDNNNLNRNQETLRYQTEKQETARGQVTSNIWNLITVDNVNTALKAALESAKTSSTSQDLALNYQLCM